MAGWAPPEAAADASWAPPEAADNEDPVEEAAQAALHYGSRAVGQLGGGLTYLGTLAATRDPKAAAAVQQSTEDALDIEPATPGGKALVARINKAAAPVGAAIQSRLQRAGDTTFEQGIPVAPGVNVGAGTPFAGAYGQVLPQAVGQLFGGGLAAKGLEAPPEIPESTVPPVGSTPLPAPQRALPAPGERPPGPITAQELTAAPDPLQLKGPPQAAPAPAAGPTTPPTPAAASAPPVAPDATFENTPPVQNVGTSAQVPPVVPPAAPAGPPPASPVNPPPAATGPVTPPAGAAPPGPQSQNGPSPQSQTGPTGDPTIPPRFTPPSAEGAVTEPLPEPKQAARKAVLQQVNEETGGALPETRQSAITGSYQDAGTDFQHAKIDDEGGRRMTGVLGGETNAMRALGQKLVDVSGDPAGGSLDSYAVSQRGNALADLTDSLHQHFGLATRSLYAGADQVAGQMPLSLPRVQQLASDPSQFVGTMEGEALHRGLQARMQALGFGRTPNSTFSPPTVKQGENLYQWAGDQYTPRTGKLVARIKDAINEDTAEHADKYGGSPGAPSMYAAARNMNTIRNKLLIEPQLMKDLAPADDRQGLNRKPTEQWPDHIMKAGLAQFNHLTNVIKSAAHISPAMAVKSASAMNALRGQAAALLHAGGAHPERTEAAWDPKGYYQRADALALKLPALFSPSEIRLMRLTNTAGNTLRLDKRYPGAAAQEANTNMTPTFTEKGRAVLGKGARGIANVGALHAGHLGPMALEMSGIGHGIERIVGGNPEEKVAKRAEAARAAEVEKRIVPLTDEKTKGPTLGQKIGGTKQRGGPKFTPPKAAEPGARVNVGLHVGNPGEPGFRVMDPREAVRAIQMAGGKVGKTSVVQSDTEPTLVADLEKPFAQKTLHGLSKQLGQGAIAQQHTAGGGLLAGPKAEDWGGEYNPDFFREHNGKTATENGSVPKPAVKNTAPIAPSIAKHMTEPERAQLRSDTAARLTSMFKDLPSTHEYVAAALAGEAKRGWYRKSAETIANVFGPDAPRFSALLAAMSPKTSVQVNFHNALRTFVNWDKEGRPQDPKSIKKIMEKSSLKSPTSKGSSNVLGAWVNNSVRALTDPNPDTVTLSGPKVDSFNKNLRDHVNEVTNDAWMSTFANVDPARLAGNLNKSGPGKSPMYLAMSAKVRAAAGMLSKLTGEKWTPREVQETVWSWAKTAWEHADKTKSTIPELVNHGKLTDDLIRSTPDFYQLFADEGHRGFLSGSRFGEAAERVSGEPSTAASSTPASQARTAAVNTLQPHLKAAARRLEGQRQKRTVTEADEEVPF